MLLIQTAKKNKLMIAKRKKQEIGTIGKMIMKKVQVTVTIVE